eukprot:CAMPEP_0117824964 /NCGR_PEP_ID=MMETSP0949-20121206/5209_1 /TAXON_ID=44440 /ORGANISM="Chattonella subsalsa, Strain CCMP2191" /LENGTH=42 /DNA_ID= /DNA_START= /DNA_END= /DNA_ORIENTATION=
MMDFTTAFTVALSTWPDEVNTGASVVGVAATAFNDRVTPRRS